MATPNMNLTLPVVSQTPGPEWASQINSDLSLIDSHDHTSTKGARIPVAALNINDNIDFLDIYGLTGIQRITFADKISTPPAQSVYVDGVDFWYRDGNGNQIQLTASGAVNVGSVGAIQNLAPPALAEYVAAESAFKFWSNNGTSTLANMEIGAIKVTRNAASAQGVTITASASQTAGNYTLTLPTTTPAAVSLFGVSVGATGPMSYVTTNSTLTLTSSLLKVATSGITSNELGANSVITAKILDGNVTQAKLGARTVNASSPVASASTTSTSSVSVSGLSVTTTLRSGYSYRIELIPTGVGPTAFQLNSGPAYDGNVDIVVVAPGPSTSTIAAILLPWGGTYSSMPSSAVSTIYTAGSSGSFTFRIDWYVDNAAATLSLTNMKMVVYEL